MTASHLRAVPLAATLLVVPLATTAAPPADGQRAPALRAPLAGHPTLAAQMHAAAGDLRRARLATVAAGIHRRVARLRRDRVAPGLRARLRDDAPSLLRDRIAVLRGDLRAARRLRAFERVPVPGALDAIADCESGGDPDVVGGGGLYRGKYQFDRHTWRSVGGAGDPAAAPEAEQDARAARLYRRAGAAPWPVCGR